MRYKIIIHDTRATKDGFIDNPIDVSNNVIIGSSIHERYAEELDIGTMIVSPSNRKKEFDMFSLVEIISLKDNTIIDRHDMWIISDDVVPLSKKTKPEKYRHTVRLMELTSRLDQEMINTLSFTQPIQSIRNAPFEQKYQFLLNDVWQTGMLQEEYFTIKLPKLNIKESYVEKVKIPQVEEAEFRYLSTTFTTKRTYPVRLFVYKVTPDNTESFVVGLNTYLSDKDTELDLADGNYRFRVISTGEYETDEETPPTTLTGRRILDYYVRVNRSNRKTLFDLINIIRNTTPLEKKSQLDQTRIFDLLDEDLITLLKSIYAPQLLMSQITVRQGLNEVFKYINAVCRLVFKNKTLNLIVNQFNNRNKPFEIEDIFAFNTDKDILNYNTKIRTYLSNLIGNDSYDKPTISQPSFEDFEGFRSETLQLTPSTPKIFLKERLYRLVKVEARVKFKCPINAEGSQATITKTVDITNRVLELEEFRLKRAKVFLFGEGGLFGESALDVTSDPRKSFRRETQIEFATYKYLGKEIDFSGTTAGLAGFFQVPMYEIIIQGGINEELVYDIGKPVAQVGHPIENQAFFETAQNPRMAYYVGFPISSRTISSDFGSQGQPDERKISNVEIKVDYIAVTDSVHDSHKLDTSEIFKSTTKKVNQNGKLINFERATSNAYGIAQRYGVPTIKFSKHAKFLKNLPQVGDFTQNNEVIVEKETVLQNNYKIANYEATKSFNRLSKYVGIDKEFRAYEIPSPERSVLRNDVYNEFLEFEARHDPFVEYKNDTFIAYKFLETMYNTLKKREDVKNSKISSALVRTEGTKIAYPDESSQNKNYVFSPVVSLGGKYSLSFRFGWDSNRVAGDSVDYQHSFWKGFSKAYGLWQQFIQYTDDDGKVNEMFFRLTDELPVEKGIKDVLTYYPSGGEPYEYETSTQAPIPYKVTREFPLVRYQENLFNKNIDDITFVKTGTETSEDPLMIYKDPSEKYHLNYQISFVPKDKDAINEVIIGEYFTKNNVLIGGKSEDLILYLYEDNTKYLEFDDKRAKESKNVTKINLKDNEEDLQIVYRSDSFGNFYPIGITINLTPNTTSWAIANEEGNLYLACNSNKKYLVLLPRNKRRDVQYDWLNKKNTGFILSTSIASQVELDFYTQQEELIMGTTLGSKVLIELMPQNTIDLAISSHIGSQTIIELGSELFLLSISTNLDSGVDVTLSSNVVYQHEVNSNIGSQVIIEVEPSTPIHQHIESNIGSQTIINLSSSIMYQNEINTNIGSEVNIELSGGINYSQDTTTNIGSQVIVDMSPNLIHQHEVNSNIGSEVDIELAIQKNESLNVTSGISSKVEVDLESSIVKASFNSNGGTPSYSSVSGNKPLYVNKPSPDPTKSGYTFDGWSPSLPRNISSDTTFTAQWLAPQPDGSEWVEDPSISSFDYTLNIEVTDANACVTSSTTAKNDLESQYPAEEEFIGTTARVRYYYMVNGIFNLCSGDFRFEVE